MTASTTYRGTVDDVTQSLLSSSDTPRIDAEVLMLHVLQKPLAWLIAHGDSIALATHLKQFYALIEQRQVGQPIAYLIGHKEFWSLSLKVTPDVLIPRADTETLIEQALILLNGRKQVKILDLGTGSGAIALALAKELPEASVMAVDWSEAALAVARTNAKRHKLHNVQFIQSNWFSQLDPVLFDLIASNPPYIEPGDPHLSQGDLRFEPSTALVSEGEGLDALRSITQAAPSHLHASGHLVVEHGFNQATKVADFFKLAGFGEVNQHRDLNGLLRCTTGTRAS